mmetsp:Transcript_503/g.1061  ORF Transcript_503/g.1061 Transcript_503/m.1061 type:complete len:276 (-) Transcript_503:540-1367(-)
MSSACDSAMSASAATRKSGRGARLRSRSESSPQPIRPRQLKTESSETSTSDVRFAADASAICASTIGCMLLITTTPPPQPTRKQPNCSQKLSERTVSSTWAFVSELGAAGGSGASVDEETESVELIVPTSGSIASSALPLRGCDCVSGSVSHGRRLASACGAAKTPTAAERRVTDSSERSSAPMATSTPSEKPWLSSSGVKARSSVAPIRQSARHSTSVYESANRQPGLSASLCIYSGTRCTKIVQMQPASGSARPKKSRNSGAWPDPEKKARYT